MKSLYLRIYVTVVLVLALFALGSGWLFQRQVEAERGRLDAQVTERVGAWAELIQRSLPAADAPPEEQAEALREWAARLRLPIALDDSHGERIAESELYAQRQSMMPGAPRGMAVRLDDGRTLWVLRGPVQGLRNPNRNPPPPLGLTAPPWARGTGLLALLVVLFIAVAAGAYPVVRRLTRRLESLKQGRQLQPGRRTHRSPGVVAQEPAGQCQP
jgi:hypothetical protein